MYPKLDSKERGSKGENDQKRIGIAKKTKKKKFIYKIHSAGYQLYLTLTNDDVLLEVEKSSRILWYYIFTYGLAFLIVTIAIAIDPYVYTRADYCVWMEQTSVFYSTFIAPIIIFIVVSAP